MLRLSRFALLLLPLALAACDSSSPGTGSVAAVYVLNQGQFGNDASGAVTTYNPVTEATGRLTRPGGNVQAAHVEGDRLYLLINFGDSFSTGRGRIDVIDTATGETIRQIDVGTPRGMAVVGETAFVTDLYGASVTPVDLASGTIGAAIPVGDNPEGVAASGDRVFVANSGFGYGTTLSVVSASGRQTDSTVDLGCVGPDEVVADGDGDIWVMCTGRSDFETGEIAASGQVVVLDGSTLDIVERFEFSGELLGGAALGQDAAYDAARGDLYVIRIASGINAADTVTRFATGRNALDAELSVSGSDLSGVGFADDRLYLAHLDALNPFSDDGTVTFHDRSGDEIARFTAGVVPAAFAFASRDLTTQE